MFGYNERQKERLKREKPGKPTRRQWNYLYIKKRLSKKSDELLIIEEFKTNHLEKQWNKLTANQSMNKYIDDSNSQNPYEKTDLHRTLSGIIEENSGEYSSNSHNASKAFDKFK